MQTETPQSAVESFRVRCPHCRKLYLVQFGDIHETKPRFECSQCHERFWLSLPDMDLTQEMIGLPVEMKQAPVRKVPVAARELEPCPKCFKTNDVNARECQHCGVVLFKARALQNLDFDEALPPHSPALASTWKKVIDDYANADLHAAFLRTAEGERHLPYAAAQYVTMQKLMPTDEITLASLREVEALASTMLAEPAPRAKRAYPRLWQVPLFGAAFLILVGLALPSFRQIVGVGAAFLFLAVAIQLQIGRKR